MHSQVERLRDIIIIITAAYSRTHYRTTLDCQVLRLSVVLSVHLHFLSNPFDPPCFCDPKGDGLTATLLLSFSI